MDEWIFEPLSPDHLRGGFSCGKSSLDDFLHLLASQYEKRGMGRTYVGTLLGDKNVRGYYTLASSSIEIQYLPPAKARKLPKHPVPVALLGRLAVDQRSQGRGLGEELLWDALARCLKVSKEIGINSVVVSALDEDAKRFYRKFGFEELLERPFHLFLAINTVEDSLRKKG